MRPEAQRRGFGSEALRVMLEETKSPAVATVTRNPATARLVRGSFEIVSPDVTISSDPLRYATEADVLAITHGYAKHIGAQADSLPIVYDRYEASGLYGGEDPGRHMPIPEVAKNVSNAVIVAGIGRR